MATWARVRDDLARSGQRIFEHKTGTYYSAEDLGEVLVHTMDDSRGLVNVVTDTSYLRFDSIDLDYNNR